MCSLIIECVLYQLLQEMCGSTQAILQAAHKSTWVENVLIEAPAADPTVPRGSVSLSPADHVPNPSAIRFRL